VAGGRRVHPGPQRVRIPDSYDFDLQNASFQGPRKGPSSRRSWTPGRADAVMVGEGRPPRCGSTSCEWQETADESIAAPKGRESRTPKHFPLQIASFLGTATGAMMAIADPSGRHPLRR
jgi:hypothetical protein